jgi:hypothetical protein
MLLYAGRGSIKAQYIVVDVKAAIARFGLKAAQESQASNEIEYIAWFRFAVTWSYLECQASQKVSRTLPNSAASQIPPGSTSLVATVSPLSDRPLAVTDTSEASANSRPAISSAQWEMVVPKMVRPPAKEVVSRISAPPPAAASDVKSSAQVSVIGNPAPADVSTPPLLLYTPDDTFLERFWRQIALGVIAMVAVAFLVIGRSDTGAPAAREGAVETASMGGWSRRSLSPPGRLMSVYEPSREESDYRIEFRWVPDNKGVGWVFRTRTAGDYYGARLTLLQPGARLVLAAEHFSVFGGVESAHSRKVIPLVNNSGVVRVRMDAVGPTFTLSLQDSAVDYWTDARLDSGAVGFYDERGRRPQVQALRFTFIKKGATRSAVASLP